MSRRRAAVFLRVVIGTILLITAVGKLLDVAGFARILAQYRALPQGAVAPVAVLVPVVEVLLALWLFWGRGLVAAAVASSVLHLGYAGWSASAVSRGLRLPNCGCFGVFLARPLGWSTVAEDLALLAASITLAVLAARRRVG